MPLFANAVLKEAIHLLLLRINIPIKLVRKKRTPRKKNENRQKLRNGGTAVELQKVRLWTTKLK
jgi:hypothetical protein